MSKGLGMVWGRGVLWAAAVMTVASGCGGDDGGRETATMSGTITTTVASTTAGSSTTAGGSGDSGSASTSTSAGSTTTGMMPRGVCAVPCNAAVDCCFGLQDCPGPAFPLNVECTDNFCELPSCSADSECVQFELEFCVQVDGRGQCFNACATDGDCMGGNTCQDVQGMMACADPGCSTDLDCGGNGTCDVATGECVCTSDFACNMVGMWACKMQ